MLWTGFAPDQVEKSGNEEARSEISQKSKTTWNNTTLWFQDWQGKYWGGDFRESLSKMRA
jgi:hypothetical protein